MKKQYKCKKHLHEMEKNQKWKFIDGKLCDQTMKPHFAHVYFSDVFSQNGFHIQQIKQMVANGKDNLPDMFHIYTIFIRNCEEYLDKRVFQLKFKRENDQLFHFYLHKEICDVFFDVKDSLVKSYPFHIHNQIWNPKNGKTYWIDVDNLFDLFHDILHFVPDNVEENHGNVNCNHPIHIQYLQEKYQDFKIIEYNDDDEIFNTDFDEDNYIELSKAEINQLECECFMMYQNMQYFD